MTTRRITLTIDGQSFDYEARLSKHKPESYDVDLRLRFEGGQQVECRDRWASSENVTIIDSNGKERPKRGNLLSEYTTPAGTAATAPAASLLAMRTYVFLGRIRP